MQELRKHNDKYCSDLASRPENRIATDGYPNDVVNQAMFIGCMEYRGTPTYESYASMQQKKMMKSER